MSFKNFLNSLTESSKSDVVKVKFHNNKSDLYGDKNTVVVDFDNAEIEKGDLHIPVYPAISDTEDEYTHENVYAFLVIEYDIDAKHEKRTYDSPEYYEFNLSLKKIKVESIEINGDEYQAAGDKFKELLNDKDKLKKIGEAILLDSDVESFIEKDFLKNAENDKYSY